MLDLNQSINFVLPYNDDKDYQSLIILLYNERLNFVEKMRNIMDTNDILYGADGNLNYYIHTHLDMNYYRQQVIYPEHYFQTMIMDLCDRNAKHKKTLELPSFNSFYYFLENEYNFYVNGEKMENRKNLH